jgi:hypothetical protein
MKKLTFRFKGGSGSGYFGHSGRPGKHGGSSPGSGGSAGGGASEAVKWFMNKTPKHMLKPGSQDKNFSGIEGLHGPLTASSKKMLQSVVGGDNSLPKNVRDTAKLLLKLDDQDGGVSGSALTIFLESLRTIR